MRPSKKQKELLNYIDGFITGHGYGPSYREVMRALNYKSVSTVAIHVDGLIKKGFLRKRDKSARSLEVVATDNSAAAPTVKSAPASKERWLVSETIKRFEAYEKEPTDEQYDNICILIGAISVLGFDEAAIAMKSRLTSLKN